jgi:hypothetical protein
MCVCPFLTCFPFAKVTRSQSLFSYCTDFQSYKSSVSNVYLSNKSLSSSYKMQFNSRLLILCIDHRINVLSSSILFLAFVSVLQIIVVNLFSLFNDAVSSSDCIASYDHVIMNSELERMWGNQISEPNA